MIGELVSASADVYVDVWWTSGGAALFGACAVYTLQNWREVPVCPRRGLANAAAACALANTIVLTLDALLGLCAGYHLQDSASNDNSPTKPCQ